MRNTILLLVLIFNLFVSCSTDERNDLPQKVILPINVTTEYVNVSQEPLYKSSNSVNDIYVLTVEGNDDFIYGVFDNPDKIKDIELSKNFTYQFNCFVIENGQEYFFRYGVGEKSSLDYSEITNKFLYLSRSEITECIKHIGCWGEYGSYSYFYHPSTKVWREHTSILIDNNIISNGISINAEAEFRKYIFKSDNIQDCTIKIKSKKGDFEDIILTPEEKNKIVYISTIANYGASFDVLIYKVTDTEEIIIADVALENRVKFQYTVDITVPNSEGSKTQGIVINKEEPNMTIGDTIFI